jgi:hypothetical protein
VLILTRVWAKTPCPHQIRGGLGCRIRAGAGRQGGHKYVMHRPAWALTA